MTESFLSCFDAGAYDVEGKNGPGVYVVEGKVSSDWAELGAGL